MTSWVLLRGLTRESRHWGGFVRTFGEHLPGARMIALDLPGNGRAHLLRSLATVSEMAAYCREQLRQQGSNPPYHLLAMSLGAMVAVDWASSHADEIGGCVLINTSLYPLVRSTGASARATMQASSACCCGPATTRLAKRRCSGSPRAIHRSTPRC